MGILNKKTFLQSIMSLLNKLPSEEYFLSQVPSLVESHFRVKNVVLYYRNDQTGFFYPYTGDGIQLPVLEDQDSLIRQFAKRSEAVFLDGKNSAFADLLKPLLTRVDAQNRLNLIIPLHWKKEYRGVVLATVGTRNQKRVRNLIAAVQEAASAIIPFLEVERLKYENEQNFYRLFKFDHLVQIGQMIAEIAHELRTPLSTIKLEFAEMIDQHQESGNHETADSLQRIVNEINRVNTFIDSLLNFSRFKEISPEAVDLNEFVSHALRDIPRKRLPPGLTLDFKPEPGIWVETDRNRLLQVFLNILNNAFDAGGENGRIVIDLFRRPAEGTVAAQAVMVVSDNGRGIPETEKKFLFKPFYTTKTQGTGLGLFNSLNIIKTLKGDLDIHSSERGTAVHIILPAAEKNES